MCSFGSLLGLRIDIILVVLHVVGIVLEFTLLLKSFVIIAMEW